MSIIIETLARIELAWLNYDGDLGKTCFFTDDDGKKEFIEVWLPALNDQVVGSREVSPEEFGAIQEHYRGLRDSLRAKGDGISALAADGAHNVVCALGLLRWKVSNEKSTFAGRTGIRLTVFAPKS